MALVECDRIHGNTTLYAQDPPCAVFESVLYMPRAGEDARGQRSHGLYDGGGRLLAPAGRFRGPVRENAGPLPTTSQRPAGLPFHGGPFFYLGRHTTHYGHFLIDTLCRLWAWREQGVGAKILYHGLVTPAEMFAQPFAAAIFGACGLGPEDFVKFDEPVRLGRVVVASPAMEELNFIHTGFARRFNEIGDIICPRPVARRNDMPVYLSKRNVMSGISHFVNEARFTEVLERAGVRIIEPEALGFAEQVALFRENSLVSGLIGSAFHTSLFTPRCRMLVLNYERTVWSNQLLVDRANGNEARYVCEAAGSRALGGDGRFMNRFEMHDPVRLAEDFLRAMDKFSGVPSGQGARMVPASPPETKHRYAICACARWETPYIVEWLSYYREIGFDHVYLYCNDDDPGPFYEAVLPFMQGAAPFVTFRHHPHQGQQLEMYAHFAAHGLEETEWVGFFDIDEFLRLPPGLTIAQFMGRFIPEVECVMFNWVFFGPNGHKTPSGGKILEELTRRERVVHPFTKFVARGAAVAEVDFSDANRAHGFWHEFGTKVGRVVISANVLGEHMMDYYQGFPARPAAFVNEPERRAKLLETAVVHHYAFRCEQAFWDRSARGLKGAFDGQAMWQRIAEGPNFTSRVAELNEVEDLSLAGFWGGVRARAMALGTGLPEAQTAADAPLRPDHISQGKSVMRQGDDWRLDLGAMATITEVHLPVLAGGFSLGVSIEGTAWVTLLMRRDDAAEPVIWAGPGTAWARFVRVVPLGPGGVVPRIEVFGSVP